MMSNLLKQLIEVSVVDFIYNELHSDLNHCKYRFVKNNTIIEFVDDTGKMSIYVSDFLANNYSCFR